MGETVADKVKVSLGMPRTSAMAIWTVLQLLIWLDLFLEHS